MRLAFFVLQLMCDTNWIYFSQLFNRRNILHIRKERTFRRRRERTKENKTEFQKKEKRDRSTGTVRQHARSYKRAIKWMSRSQRSQLLEEEQP